VKDKKILWGLLTRRERLGLSGLAWLLLVSFAVGAALIVLFTARPFLAQTLRVDGNVVVMEGWLREFAVRKVAHDFQNGPPHVIYITGGPIIGMGDSTNDLDSLACVGAELLKKYAVPPAYVQMVPAHEVGRDRTYTSAVALRNWFQTHGLKIHSFTIYTEDAHARRTRLLFQKAFGPEVTVGVIAIPDPDYDPAHWWRYSEGVRTVLGESIAYLYARFLFHPTDTPVQP
jgi:uncharacterized SAM-binding protein YcdF (DUF218 family)